MMNDLSKSDMQPESNMLALIERAARDPAVDIDKMERIMLMHERSLARQEKASFDASMSQLQPELPVVGERGNAAGRYTYALWEDINAAIKPVLMKYGFALTFRTDFANGITVTGVLAHKDGHREETSITLPADKSGNKNDVQAVASSVSYGKRYTAGALLNLTTHGEDDDAYAAGNKMDDKALDWVEAIHGATTLDAYKRIKADAVKSYGTTDKVPRQVVAAFNARFAQLKEGK